MEKIISVNDVINGIDKVSRIAFNIKGGYSAEQTVALMNKGQITASFLKQTFVALNKSVLKNPIDVSKMGNYDLLKTLQRNKAKLLKAIGDKVIPFASKKMSTGVDLDI